MNDGTDRQRLYRDTFDTASFELCELSREIARTRAILEHLERRRKAVTQLCEALGTWIALSDHEEVGDDEEPDAPVFEVPPPGLGLTEEEVSLIAYPEVRRHSA
jgi:hypothetical protein